MAEQILAHDHDGQPGRSDVLLRAGKDHAVFRDVDHARQDVRRHVGHDRHVAGIRHEVKLDAVDGFVGADVQIGRILAQLPAAGGGTSQKRPSVAAAAMCTLAYFFASLIDLLVQEPVWMKSTVAGCGLRQSGSSG